MSCHDPQSDLNTRGQRLARLRETSEHQVWRLLERLPTPFARHDIDHVEEIAKAARREAARRAVDNLLR